MRVVMKVNITGFRNLEPWPPVGGVIDLPEREAVELIGQGYAKAADDDQGDTPADDVIVSDEPGDNEPSGDGDGTADDDQGDTPAPATRGRRKG